MNEQQRRLAVLATVARGEIVRDADNHTRIWVGGGYEPMDRDDLAILHGLAEAGHVTVPEREPGDRRDLRYDITNKALEG